MLHTLSPVINGIRLDFPTHAADVDVHLNVDPWNFFRTMMAKTKFFRVDTDYAWSGTAVGSGAVVGTDGLAMILRTGATINSSIFNRTITWHLNPAAAGRERIEWDKRLSLFFTIARNPTDAQAVSRVQLKEADIIGVLAEKGIGLNLANLALSGEAYGTSRGTVDLATTITANRPYRIEIQLTSTGVEFFVDNVSKGSITTAGTFPTGADTASGRVACDHANGAAGTNSDFEVGNIYIVQEL